MKHIVFGGGISAFYKWLNATAPAYVQIKASRNEARKKARLAWA